MSLVDQLNGKTPREALLLLAQEIDALREDINNAPPMPADPWDQPLDWNSEPMTMAEMAAAQQQVNAVTAQALEIKNLREALAAATDPDEVRVLNAKLALAMNPGTIPPDALAEGKRAVVAGDDVVQAPPTPERIEARREWARRYQLWTFLEGTWTEELAIDTFAKGGARWLYYDGGRDVIMAMPPAARQALCADIAIDSPAEAAEVARDILKSEKSVDQNTVVEALQRMAEHG